MLEYQILKISCQKINYFTLCKKKNVKLICVQVVCFMNVHSFQVTQISQRITLNILSLCLKNQGVQTVAHACLCINNTISIIEAPVICNYSKQPKIQPLSFSFLFFDLITHTRPKNIIRLKSYKRNVNLNSPQYTHTLLLCYIYIDHFLLVLQCL